MTRGLRNNNPLNIRHSKDKWQGTATTQTDRSFVQFESMAYGYRAAWKTLEEFVRWSLRYDLWCKMHFFGDAIEKADKSPEPSQHSNPQNLLAMLPTVFTREEAAQLRQRVGISQGNLAQMLANWKHRGYIEPYGEPSTDLKYQQYTKTEDYLKKFLITQKT